MTKLDEAFDAERFRDLGHRLIDALADHLARANAGDASLPVLPRATPEELCAQWNERSFADRSARDSERDSARNGERGAEAEELLAFYRRVLDTSHHLHHPRYVGHQVTSPMPDAALAALVAALLNNSMAVFEMGPASTAMERAVVAWMARKVGWSAAADGVLTSGGSLGNLTAMLAMRAARSEPSEDPRTLAVLVSDQAHYSVRRAVTMMGWGDDGVVSVRTDARFKMRADALVDARERARAKGRRVLGVVASACSTATGAFDPIGAIADYAEKQGIWLHVDGAHGAVAALSPRLRARLEGIERADSMVWDAHKMMMIPSLVTAVLFRDGESSWKTFATRASYLFADAERPWWDIALRTVECTKKMMSLEVFAPLALHGEGLFRDYVERTFDLASAFADRIRASSDFELAVDPECNIVCFRFVGALRGDDRDRLQAEIRRRIVESGRFYLVQTGLPTGTFLRTTIINPRTTLDDLVALLEEIRVVARKIEI